MADSARIDSLLFAARRSPQFALQLLASLPADIRAEALRRWSTDQSPQSACGPSVRKCSVEARPLRATSQDGGMAAQLRAFSRSVRGPSRASS